MNRKPTLVLLGAIAVAGVCSLVAAWQNPAAGQRQSIKESAPDKKTDEDAIRKVGKEFAAAFDKGDAKTAASFWTEHGECHQANGEMVIGRADIEKHFADTFKEHPGTKIEVMTRAIRFPAPDLAIEEGVLRQTSKGNDLPMTTMYSATHIREGGRWKIAVSHEWGVGEDRLEDMDWLVGKWKAKMQNQEVTLTIARDPHRPFLMGQFKKEEGGKVIAGGTMRIGFDMQRGQLHSWHFDDDGGHGEAMWVRDGNRWVLDSFGVNGEGVDTACVTILGRVSDNEITWRSIDRVLGEQSMPDTMPIKLVRITEDK